MYNQSTAMINIWGKPHTNHTYEKIAVLNNKAIYLFDISVMDVL